MPQPRWRRVHDARLDLDALAGVPVSLFANADVPIERAATRQLLDLLRGRPGGPGGLADALAAAGGALERVALTPDFHPASPVPVGTALATRGAWWPGAIGADVNCGMRLQATTLRAGDLAPHLDALEGALRHVFFEGGRALPTTPGQRGALLAGGLPGLRAATPGGCSDGLWALWRELGPDRELARVDRGGGGAAPVHPAFAKWVRGAGGRSLDRASFDGQLGSIGGGNHFVEVGEVTRVFDARPARAWGLAPGAVTVLVHSGSLGFGRAAADAARGLARGRPGVLAADDPAGEAALGALGAAANFAFGNRLFLALAALKALRESGAGDFGFSTVYDAPHNFVWRDGDVWVHRKGATPARGPGDLPGTPFEATGEPVLVPGSMGAPSFVLAGLGAREALSSASHGAGRALARGAAMRADPQDALRGLRVVTPLDPREARAEVRRRKLAELAQEAPGAYKPVAPVVESLAGAGLARPVAELRPLVTVKS